MTEQKQTNNHDIFGVLELHLIYIHLFINLGLSKQFSDLLNVV